MSDIPLRTLRRKFGPKDTSVALSSPDTMPASTVKAAIVSRRTKDYTRRGDRYVDSEEEAGLLDDTGYDDTEDGRIESHVSLCPKVEPNRNDTQRTPSGPTSGRTSRAPSIQTKDKDKSRTIPFNPPGMSSRPIH